MKFKIAIIFLGMLISQVAFCGVATGKIQSIEISDSNTAILFSMNTAIENTPRCNDKQMFSINLAKVGGEAAFTALLEAKLREYEVTVTGLNTCVNEWKAEDIKTIKIH
ncbi:hypothetical protein P886_1180 [Alteromonadaceae bacterium 2753L.S.0a.02]|nr:hypothetical protein P886_1180 [Alteromonadaceae bacterium 2753L.S.0a.02]